MDHDKVVDTHSKDFGGQQCVKMCCEMMFFYRKRERIHNCFYFVKLISCTN